jgi:hypothetical protein
MGINPRLLLAGSHVVPGILSEGMARALREKSTISSTDLRAFDSSLTFPPTPRGSSLLAYSSSKCIMTVEKIEKRDSNTFRLIFRHISQIPRDIAPRVSGPFLLSCPDPLEDFMFCPSAPIFVLHPSLRCCSPVSRSSTLRVSGAAILNAYPVMQAPLEKHGRFMSRVSDNSTVSVFQVVHEVKKVRKLGEVRSSFNRCGDNSEMISRRESKFQWSMW